MKTIYLTGALIALAPMALLAQVGRPPVGNSMETGAPSTTQHDAIIADGADDAAMDTNSVDTAPLPDPKQSDAPGSDVATHPTDDAPPPKW